MKYIKNITLVLSFVHSLYGKEGRLKTMNNSTPDPFRQSAVAKIGDNPFPTNPMSDRAKGFIDQGRVKVQSQTTEVL